MIILFNILIDVLLPLHSGYVPLFAFIEAIPLTLACYLSGDVCKGQGRNDTLEGKMENGENAIHHFFVSYHVS